MTSLSKVTWLIWDLILEELQRSYLLHSHPRQPWPVSSASQQDFSVPWFPPLCGGGEEVSPGEECGWHSAGRVGWWLTLPTAVVPSKACDPPVTGRASGDHSVREAWLR